MIIEQHLCDYRFQNCFVLSYDEDTKKVHSWSFDKAKDEKPPFPKCVTGNHKNKIYYYYDYDKPQNKHKDIVWISDDNYIIEIDDTFMKYIKNIEFFDKLRELKTRDKILNYLNYLEL
jgi:hypothetical protein